MLEHQLQQFVGSLETAGLQSNSHGGGRFYIDEWDIYLSVFYNLYFEKTKKSWNTNEYNPKKWKKYWKIQ